MADNPFFSKTTIMIAAALSVVITLLFIYRSFLWDQVVYYTYLFSDRESTKTFIKSFGIGAPVVFMVIQILQVMFAPIPGEATGFLGGYLFGAVEGFLYSSIALSIGSWINFFIGHMLGTSFVRRMISESKLARFDAVMKRQGILIVLTCFIFPGFPKDYLCYFLGISAIPVKVFIVLSSFGRMPGTFMLSLQGALLFNQSYGQLAVFAGFCILLVVLGYVYREKIYGWVERMNHDN